MVHARNANPGCACLIAVAVQVVVVVETVVLTGHVADNAAVWF